MISPDQVYHRKHCRARRRGTKRMDVRKRVPIITIRVIQPPEISTRAPTTVWLRHHVEWRCPRRTRRPDDLHGQHLVKFLLGDLKFVGKERPGTRKHWDHMSHPMCRNMIRLKPWLGDSRKLSQNVRIAWLQHRHHRTGPRAKQSCQQLHH